MSLSQPDVDQLKFVVLDPEDLAVASAHLQDAVIRVGDLAYLPEQNRFAFVARRFDWEAGGPEPRRRLTGMHFDRVLRCRTRGIDRSQPDQVLNLLAVTFEAGEAPSGRAMLVFAGQASIEIELECIEAAMKDLGPVWSCRQRPAHDLENT